MMKKRRRIRMTVETERLMVVTRTHGSIEGRCHTCDAKVRMIAVEEASVVTGLSQRAIFRGVEAGRLHFTETPGGKLLICLNSLWKHTRAGTNAQSGLLRDQD
jgi:hypothetical protein